MEWNIDGIDVISLVEVTPPFDSPFEVSQFHRG